MQLRRGFDDNDKFRDWEKYSEILLLVLTADNTKNRERLASASR